MTTLDNEVAALEFPDTSFLIDRSEEAEQIASVILRAPSRFVVLYGAPDSGKTDLVVRSVIPALVSNTGGHRTVFYAACAPRFPNELAGADRTVPIGEALRGDSVIIIDEFERVLTLPRDQQDDELDRMFATLAHRGPQSVIVLMVDAREMNAVYALASYDTDATETVHELRALTADEALARMGASPGGARIEYSPEVLEEIRAEVEGLGANRWSDTFDLTTLIHRRALALARQRGATAFTSRDYAELGRAPGILRSHLEHKLEVLDARHPGDADTARAILERTLDASAKGMIVNLADAGPRLGISATEVQRVIALLQDEGLLVLKRGGEWRVVPPQLLKVVEEDLADRVRQIDRAQRTVAEGLRDWRRQGTLLSAHRLAEVHAERRHLTLDDEQHRFLLQSALLHGADECARYWLDRIPNRDDGLTMLFRTIVHESVDVRRRSAMFLRSFDAAHVVERLVDVVLSDPDATVREAAIESLEGIATPAVRTKLLSEAIMMGGHHRGPAIDALRLFRTTDVADFLKMLVSDRTTPSDLRARAVRALARLDLPQSVDMLVDIALEDVDRDDRVAAASALGTIGATPLNLQIFHRLQGGQPVSVWLMSVLFGTVFALVLFVLFLIVFESDSSVERIATLLAIGVPCALVSGRLIVRMHEGEFRPLSPLGVLAAVLFLVSAVTAVPLIHGLAHLSINRRQRGAQLFGIAVLGAMCVTVLPSVLNGVAGFSALGNVYLTVGLLALFGAYLYDVVAVLLGSFILPRTTARYSRKKYVYREVLANPAGAAVLFEAMERPSTETVRSARSLFRRFGSSIRSVTLVDKLRDEHPATVGPVTRVLKRTQDDAAIAELEKVWPSARASLRARIISIYHWHADRASAALKQVSREDSTIDTRRRPHVAALARMARLPLFAIFVGVILLPTIGAVMLNGVMMTVNPAWAELTALRRPHDIASSMRDKPKIIAFLADAYPERSARHLAATFSERTEADSVHAALVIALSHADVRRNLKSDSLRVVARLRDAVAQYTTALLDSRDDLALTVLTATALDSDRGISDSSVAALVRLIASAPVDSGTVAREDHRRHKQLAIAGLGKLDVRRALLLLDSLTKDQDISAYRDRDTKEALVRQLLHVSRVTALAMKDSTKEERAAMLTLLGGLQYKHNEIDADKELLGAATNVSRLLQYVRDYPDEEGGYVDLVEGIAKAGGYRAAARQLETLAENHSDRVWLMKTLAMVYHENLAPAEPSYFQRSYNVMVALRDRPSYQALRTSAPADYHRIETDFVEVVLSTGRYHETDSLSLEPAVQTSATDSLNAALFAYMGFAIAGEREAALNRLMRVKAVVNALGPEIYNNWLYPGTEAYIRQAARPDVLRDALLKLCRSGRWYSTAEAAAIIAENEAALAR